MAGCEDFVTHCWMQLAGQGDWRILSGIVEKCCVVRLGLKLVQVHRLVAAPTDKDGGFAIFEFEKLA